MVSLQLILCFTDFLPRATQRHVRCVVDLSNVVGIGADHYQDTASLPSLLPPQAESVRDRVVSQAGLRLPSRTILRHTLVDLLRSHARLLLPTTRRLQ
jgi:hypothetical protein